MMRYWLFLLFGVVSSFSFAQVYDLSGLQGLKNKKGETFFELGGYDMFIYTEKGQLSNLKTIDKIKAAYHIGNVLAEYPDNKISVPNRIIEAERPLYSEKGSAAYQVCALLQLTEKEITVIYFETLNQRDILLEEQIITTYLQNQLAPYVSIDWTTRSIPLAGKQIQLGNSYGWEAPHDIYGDGGRIRWSEFTSMMSAELDINNRIDASFTNEMQILHEGDVKVLFDGVPTIAYRIVYRERYSETPFEPLIVYYIAEEIRGVYVSCLLSYYGRHINDYNLPPLLSKVMRVAEIPAIIDFPDEPEDDVYYHEEHKALLNMFEVQAGTWLPAGKLSRAFHVAPSIGLYIGYPFSDKMKLDIGAQLAFPINPQPFNFYNHDVRYETSSSVIIGFNIRFHYQQQLNENTYLTTYGGIGVNGITTDLEKEYYEEDEYDYYSCETLDLLGGVNLRYKKIGCFLEYHFVPYSISGKVKSSFGNSAFNMGLMFSF